MEENKEERQNDSAEEPIGQEESPLNSEQSSSPEKSTGRGLPWGWIGTLIFAVAFSVMLTYTLTAMKVRNKEIQSVQTTPYEQLDENTVRDVQNVDKFVQILKERSFYADSMDDWDTETLLKAVMEVYIEESNDVYAAYYTLEEYAELAMDMAGNRVGIGVTITQDSICLDESEDDLEAYLIQEVYPGSGAEEAGLAVGEWIGAVKIDGAYQAVGELGLKNAAKVISGDAGTQVELMILHWNGTAYDSRTVAVTRSAIVTRSVRLSYAESDPTVAVVRISGFDYTTPTQFREAVDEAKEAGALHFVFDVRGNPGGELSSIYAVLSNFLQEGDLVLAMTDANGTRVEYRMKPEEHTGLASECSVKQEQIGQYRDLDFVILCDENTASAAEVFTATLRDFHLAKAIVGQKTFGKGIVQSYRAVQFDDVIGYLKVTVAEYVTECGESYHGKGIEPTVSVRLPKAVRGKSTTFLAWEDDRQLQTAVAQFQTNDNENN